MGRPGFVLTCQVLWVVLKNLTVVARAAALLYDYGKDSNLDSKKKRQRMGKRITQLLMDAGGIFPKVGQNLAERPDLIPYAEIREALKKCQAQVPSMKFKKVRDLLNQCKIDTKKVFPLLDEATLAAASIGQLHKYGKAGAMVLKVLNLENQTKIRNQKSLVKALTLIPATGKAEWMIALIDRTFHEMEKEGNLSDEFRNTQFGKAMVDSICSNPEWAASGHNIVLVQKVEAQGANMVSLPQQNIHIKENGAELLNSPCVKFDEFLSNPMVPEVLRKQCLKSLIALFGKMVFFWQAFHCDPHPGNIYVRYEMQAHADHPDLYSIVVTEIFLIDWGGICIIDEADPSERDFLEHLEAFLLAVVNCAQAPGGSELPQELVDAAINFGFEWEGDANNRDKVDFCFSLVSSRCHTLWIRGKKGVAQQSETEKTEEKEAATPKNLPPMVLHLLRVQANLGSYGNYVDAGVELNNPEDEAKISTAHHTDGVWAAMLQQTPIDQRISSDQRKTLRSEHLGEE